MKAPGSLRSARRLAADGPGGCAPRSPIMRMGGRGLDFLQTDSGAAGEADTF